MPSQPSGADDPSGDPSDAPSDAPSGDPWARPHPPAVPGDAAAEPGLRHVAVEEDVVLPVHVTPAGGPRADLRVGGPGVATPRRGAGEAGPPVLLLHGFPGSWRSFDAVTAGLAAAGRRCLVPEQRGYTPSGRPREVGRYRLERLVADALAVLDDLAGTGVAASVVGHDWGAVVAWALAAQHPERVADLVTASVPHPQAYAAGLREDRGQQLRSAYVRLLRRRGTAERVLLAGGGRLLRRAFAGSAVPPGLVAAHLRPLGTAEELGGALAWYRALRGRDLTAVGPVAVPTTYLWSDRDAFVARGTAARCGAHVTGPFRTRTLRGTSHWVPEESPDEVVRAVLEPPAR